MKYGFSLIGMTVLGLLAFAGIMLFTELTVSNEEDYYSLKESLHAAMLESIDYTYYRTTGEIKIIQEKVVENFTRRFIENSMFNANSYTIEFYDIMESPPKVTVVIKDETGTYNITGGFDGNDAESFTVANNLTGILEHTNSAVTELYYYAQMVDQIEDKETIYNTLTFNDIINGKEGMEIANITIVGPITETAQVTTLTSQANKDKITALIKDNNTINVNVNANLPDFNETRGSTYNSTNKVFAWQQRYSCPYNTGCIVGIIFRIEWIPTTE